MTKRIALWDNLKFILIFLVVLGHFIDPFTRSTSIKFAFFYIYIFHMPLFIFVSGLFSKKNIDEKRYNKIFEYLILYFICQIIIFIPELIINGKTNLSLLSANGIPWFMLALFIFNILTIKVKKLDKKYALILFITLACFVGYDNNINDLFILSRVFVFYPFFLTGYYTDQKKLITFVKNKKIKILSFLFLIGSFIFIYLFIKSFYQFRPLITGRNPFSTLGKYQKYGCLIRLAYYIGVPFFMLSIISLTPTKKTIFTNLGERSLCVYLLHRPLYIMFFYLYPGEAFLDETSYLLLIPISLTITMLLSQKCFDKFINFVKKIRLIQI